MSATSCTILSNEGCFVKWLHGGSGGPGGSQKFRNMLEVRPDGDFEP